MHKAFFILLLLFSASAAAQRSFRYMPLGDSYTICEGVARQECWPSLLTEHLKKEGISVILTGNPSRTGYTTQDLIDKELKPFKNGHITFATLLIGVNDWVQGVDSATFHHNLSYILDEIQNAMPEKGKLILVTIPDFGATPKGWTYSNGRDISKGIAEFNGIIQREAEKRHLPCADVYPESQRMSSRPETISNDGLHPSGTEYILWEAIIYPLAKELLSSGQ